MLNWLRYLLRPNDRWEFEHDEEARRWEYVEAVEFDLIHGGDSRWVTRWTVNDEFVRDVGDHRMQAILIRNLIRFHGHGSSVY